jgi:hypothetical protein
MRGCRPWTANSEKFEMARRLITYKDTKRILLKLEEEEVDRKYWEEFSRMDDNTLLSRGPRIFARVKLLEKQKNRLEKIGERFDTLCSHFSPKYAKLRKIALRKSEEYRISICEEMMAYRVVTDRGLSLGKFMGYIS